MAMFLVPIFMCIISLKAGVSARFVMHLRTDKSEIRGCLNVIGARFSLPAAASF